jgi:chromosome partitioning protein
MMPLKGNRPGAHACRIVVLGGSKGGTGRSTQSRNLLVCAVQSGIQAIGIDLDKQNTFLRWSERRAKAREKLPQIMPTEVIASRVEDTYQLDQITAGYELAIIDTAPGVEEAMTSMLELCRRASLVLVPTSPSGDDLESVVPWFKNLVGAGSNGAFVLNKANRRTRSYASARSTLMRHGALCPAEIPLLEDIAAPFPSGLAVVDYEKARGAEAMADLWTYVRREIAL